ncbi:DinB family protein [Humibacillus xanthopallidus]|uniref:DinB family protein n=1 Tax=Humibacillus xanthopallidus TaxID=412689 RepID=A0A543I1D8_9MICO|nr:DinB family protein [Humibacillus xanthopallidus]TQM64345.1 DinB family protein [Humibacillus xanthopallidus]
MAENVTESQTTSETGSLTDSHTDVASESLSGETFRNRSLREARFVSCDLSDVVVRGCDVARMEIDSPWLLEDGGRLLVNGVNVVPFVDAELNHRFPGRESRAAADPEGLRSAWASVEAAWAATLDRAAAMPPGSVDATVDGEWSLAQTLRHLVMATDVWLGRAILEREQPYHPAGLPNDDHDSDAYDESAFSVVIPPFEEVMDARSGRQAMVRDFIAGLTPAALSEPRRNPHDPDVAETVLSCLRTILEEEWEHHRYAVRDLDALEARGLTPSP